MALALVCAAGVLVGLAGGASSASASDQVPTYYLALGGSGSVGFQPAPAHPEGERTDRGYANDLVVAERSRWSDLSLVQLGCPGATTGTMLSGGGKCLYAEGSQLDAAVAFLHDHPSTVLVTLDLGNAILVFAGLSFLGLGVVPPTAEWGSMVSEGRELVSQWWVATFPGLAILTVVIGFNFVGDGIRDWLDPHARRR